MTAWMSPDMVCADTYCRPVLYNTLAALLYNCYARQSRQSQSDTVVDTGGIGNTLFGQSRVTLCFYVFALML